MSWYWQGRYKKLGIFKLVNFGVINGLTLDVHYLLFTVGENEAYIWLNNCRNI